VRDDGGSEEPLSDSERNELERLRAEIREWRRQAAEQRLRRTAGWRAPVAAILITLGCLLAPLAVVAIWASNRVSDTDGYVANVTPLISNPVIQRTVTDKITAQVYSRLDVAHLTTQAATALTGRGMPRAGQLLNGLSGPVDSAVDGFIHKQVADVVASPRAASLWVQLNRVAHTELIKALSGQTGAISTKNGQVTMDLAPFIQVVKTDLAAHGLPLAGNLPTVHPTISLFSARTLVAAQTAYRLANTLAWLLPLLTVVLLGLGIYIARDHRRALLAASLGVSAAMLLLGVGLLIARVIYLRSVPAKVLPADAATVLFETFVRFIRNGLRVVLVAGLVVAAAAFLAGPSVTATRFRAGFMTAFHWTGRVLSLSRLDSTGLARWMAANRMLLRICTASIAAIILVFWPYVTVAIVLVILELAILVFIQFISRRQDRISAVA